MNKFFGVYRGCTSFSITDRKCIGEVEVTITQETILLRIATGASVIRRIIMQSACTPMPPKEIAALFEDDAEGMAAAARALGFKHHTGFPFFLFPQDIDPDVFYLIVENNILFTTATLFSPEQIARGLFAETMQNLEKEYGATSIAWLANGGKLPRA